MIDRLDLNYSLYMENVTASISSKFVLALILVYMLLLLYRVVCYCISKLSGACIYHSDLYH